MAKCAKSPSRGEQSVSAGVSVSVPCAAIRQRRSLLRGLCHIRVHPCSSLVQFPWLRPEALRPFSLVHPVGIFPLNSTWFHLIPDRKSTGLNSSHLSIS